MSLSLRRYRRRTKSQPPIVLQVEDPGHLGFNYQLRLSSRKSISLQVRNGQVRLSGPHHASRQELQLWLESKLDWIRVKLKQQRSQQQQIPQRYYVDGEVWPLMDQHFKLAIRAGKQASVALVNSVLTVTLSSRSRKSERDQAQGALINWYKQQALRILSDKTRNLCLQLGVSCNAIKLKRTRTKWGHCTPAGVIQYNWLIVQAPEFVVDYLVVHECCHLIHLNHSQAYWQLVELFLPNYRVAKQWLKDHGHRLSV